MLFILHTVFVSPSFMSWLFEFLPAIFLRYVFELFQQSFSHSKYPIHFHFSLKHFEIALMSRPVRGFLSIFLWNHINIATVFSYVRKRSRIQRHISRLRTSKMTFMPHNLPTIFLRMSLAMFYAVLTPYIIVQFSDDIVDNATASTTEDAVYPF